MSRSRVRWLFVAWLACQLTVLAASPVSLAIAPVPAAADDDAACCPGIAPGQVCPMHHTKEGGRTCAMRGTCTTPSAALLSLLGGLGLLPPEAAGTPRAVVVAAVEAADVLPLTRSDGPQSPPPR